MERFVDCELCGKTVQEGRSFRQHMGSHGLSKLKCKYCEQSYSQYGVLKRHIITIHKITEGVGDLGRYAVKREQKPKESVICNICNMAISKGNLKVHMRIHTGVKAFKCEFCGKSFTQQGVLKRHLECAHYMEDAFNYLPELECDICKKKVKGNENLKSHRRIHLKGKEIKIFKETVCGLCDFINPGIYHYESHRDKSGKYLCQICGKLEVSMGKMLRHCKAYHKIIVFRQCPFCESKFENDSILNQHKNKEHLEDMKNSRVQVRVKCDECGKEVLKKAMYTHLKIHSDLKRGCRACDKKFTQGGTLKRHMVQVHGIIDGDIKNYAKNYSKPKEEDLIKLSCRVCNKEVQSRYMKRHMMMHSGIKPYECTECNKQFSQPANFKRHIDYTHNKEETLKSLPTMTCEVCDKQFIGKILFGDHMKHHKRQIADCTLCAEKDTIRHMKLHTTVIGTTICSVCDKKFSSGSKMGRHQRTQHLVPIMVGCQYCELVFESAYQRKFHMKEHKQETRSQRKECSICGKKVKEYFLKSHMKQAHTDQRVSKCTYCEKTFTQKGSLKRHVVTTHGIVEGKVGKYLQVKRKTMPRYSRCSVCEKTLKGGLTFHMKIHTGDKSYSCNLCTLAFTQQGVWKRHMIRHEKGKLRNIEKQKRKKVITKNPFSCRICRKVFTNKNRFRFHLKKHSVSTMRKCSFCDFETMSTQEFLKHENELHKSSDGKYFCKYCQKLYTARFNLECHIKQHHETESGYTCNLCNKQFKQERILEHHKKSVHMLAPSKYKCDICEKKFVTNYEKNNHMKGHILQNHHQCKLCLEKLDTSQLLMLHMEHQHGENAEKLLPDVLKWNCTDCDRKFDDKSRLIRHARTHKSSGNLSCDVCGKKDPSKDHKLVHQQERSSQCKDCGLSLRKGSLKAHMLIHKKEKNHKCNECEKSFTQSGVLKRHLQWHKGAKRRRQ